MEIAALMPWVKFIQPFDFKISERIIIAYKPGKPHLVRQICAKQAVEKGCAVYVARPEKKDANRGYEVRRPQI